MRPITATVGPLAAASATALRTASAIGGAGAVTLNGALVTAGVATIPSPRRITFTSSGNDTGITFTIVGTDRAGNAISEVLTGASGAAATSVLDYKTVTSVTASGAAAGTVSIGTSAVAASAWIMMDSWAYGPVSVQVTVVGTVNYDVQVTMQDPNSPTDPVTPDQVIWTACADSALVGKTANAIGSLTSVPVYARVLLNSGSGTVSAVFAQPGVVPK
jgi:hypothetical protein